MGELINGCDTTDKGVPVEQVLTTVPLTNACTEIDMCSGTGETSASMHLVQRAIDAGQRVLIIAPTGRAAAAMREHLAAAGVTITPIADMRDEGLGGIAVETIDDLAAGTTLHSTLEQTGRMAARMRAPSDLDPRFIDVRLGAISDTEIEEYRRDIDLTGVMMVVDESGDIDQAHMDAVHSWLGRPFGAGKSASARMSDATMDSIFGDEVIAREHRTRHTYVLCDDDRSMRGAMGVLAMKACLPERDGFDYRSQNDQFNRRNGTRLKPTRGRYK